MEDVKNSILQEIYGLQATKRRLLVAIDGRAASGKTMLGMSLKDSLGCSLIHMDHFFLRPEQRSEERMSLPGGNVDIERFVSEVFLPLRQNKDFSYSPFDCQLNRMSSPIEINQCDIAIIEGTYSCHPELFQYYDLRIFLHIDEASQISRIAERNGESELKVFLSKWIPLEEAYFKAYNLRESCDIFFSL